MYQDGFLSKFFFLLLNRLSEAILNNFHSGEVMRHKLNLIIVDDDFERDCIYREFVRVFNSSELTNNSYNLNPIYCYQLDSSIRRINESKGPSIILLDMVRPWESDDLRSTILKSQLPLIALSEQFNSSKATIEYTYYLREHVGMPPPIVHFRDLRAAYEGDSWGTLLDVFSTHLAAIFGLDNAYTFDPDSRINIVHMTDVHMDGLSFPDDQVQDIGSILSIPLDDGVTLNADFVAITGDVTNRGEIGTYADAIGKIRKIFSHGWMRLGTPSVLPSSRVLISPGNHDFNEQLAGANILKVDSSAPGGGFKIDPSLIPGEGDSWRYGLIPFFNFHRQISGIGFPLIADYSGYRSNLRFRTHGLIFIEIWAQTFRCGSNSSAVKSDWLTKAVEDVRVDVSKNSFSGDTIVILLHHLSTENPTDFDQMLIRALAKIGKDRNVVLLTGHLHTSTVGAITFNGGGRSRVLHVRTDTMNPSQVRQGTLPSFAVVSLRRSRNAVVGCDVHRVIFDRENGWDVDVTKQRRFGLISDGWNLE